MEEGEGNILFRCLLAPFRWLHRAMKSMKDWMLGSTAGAALVKAHKTVCETVQKHPVITGTALFTACVGLTLLTGIWWLGVTIFAAGIAIFGGRTIMTGTLKLTHWQLDIWYGILAAVMVTAMVAPSSGLIWWYLLIPLGLWLIKQVKDLLQIATIGFEFQSLEEELMADCPVDHEPTATQAEPA